GKLMRLHVDDELFDVRYGELLHHERVLDFRAGVLRRSVHWRSPAGAGVKVTSTRMGSLTQRGAAAAPHEGGTPGGGPRPGVQSELVAKENGQPHGAHPDPRAAASLTAPLKAEEAYHDDLRVSLVHRLERSGHRLCATMDHEIDGPENCETTV